MSCKTSKKTICALVAGFIAAWGITGLFTVSGKDAQTNSSSSRLYSGQDIQKTGGWYTNKAQRGQAMRRRIMKYIS